MSLSVYTAAFPPARSLWGAGPRHREPLLNVGVQILELMATTQFVFSSPSLEDLTQALAMLSKPFATDLYSYLPLYVLEKGLTKLFNLLCHEGLVGILQLCLLCVHTHVRVSRHMCGEQRPTFRS